MSRVRWLRPTYFLWVVVPLAVFGVYQAYGLPHILWSYSWRDDGAGYNPSATRYYTRCTHVGSYGSFTSHPMDGECELLTFKKLEAVQ